MGIACAKGHQQEQVTSEEEPETMPVEREPAVAEVNLRRMTLTIKAKSTP